MSGGKDRRSRASKTQGWEEAGGEFYQESYPADLEGMQRDPSKIATLLPSKQTRNATTRRARPTQGQDTKGGTRRRASFSTVARRGSQYHEMQVATLPDLSENLINEERTWEEIREIKSMPVPMAQKREMKAQLQNATKLRLQGFEQIKWRRRKAWQSFRSKWGEYQTKLELWRMSLKTIEGNFGTGVVAYFLFLRWLVFLNLLLFLLIFAFVVLPHLVLREPSDLPCDLVADPTSVQCCSEGYENVTRTAQFSVLDLIQGTGFMEGTLLFYGMYTNQIYGYSPMEDRAYHRARYLRVSSAAAANSSRISMDAGLLEENVEELEAERQTILYYDLPLVYVIIIAIYYVITLVAIMRAVVRQFKDRIAEGEGLFYQYCNLVFGGWDFCIHNQKSADIKHRALHNEIKSLLYQKRFEHERNNRSREFMLKLIAIRMLINLFVFIILLLAAITIYVLFNVSLAELEPNFTPSHPVSFSESLGNRTLYMSWPSSWSVFSSASQRGAISFASTITPLLSSMNDEAGMGGAFNSTDPTLDRLTLEEKLRVLFYEFLPYLAIVCMNLVVPQLFNYLVQYEKYSPLFVIKISLFRTVFLRLSSLAVLLSRFYFLITPMNVTQKLLINASSEQGLDHTSISTVSPSTTTIPTTSTGSSTTAYQLSDMNTTFVANLTATTISVLSTLVLDQQPVPEAQTQPQQPAQQQCYDEANGAPQCWETFVGQQFYKLFIVDFATHFLVTFFVNFPRALFARHSSSRLAKFIGEQEFELSKHVLDVIYSQTLCWLGTFYTPFLPAIAALLTFLMFYIKKFACLVNSNPSAILYRASRSKSLFMSTLLISFTLALVPVVYALAEIVPSRSCGPFRGLPSVWDRAIAAFMKMPLFFQNVIFFFGTASFAIPCFVVLTFFIYYYYAVSTANRHMVQVLKQQLVLEGHDKQFLLSRLSLFIKQQQEYQKRMMRQAAEQQQQQHQMQQQYQQHSGSGNSANNVILPPAAYQQPPIVPPPRTNSQSQASEVTPALPPRADRDSKPSSRDRPKDLPPPPIPGGGSAGNTAGGVN